MNKENTKYIKRLRSKVYENLSDSTNLPVELLKKFLSGSNDIITPEIIAIAVKFGINFNDLGLISQQNNLQKV